MILTNEKGRTAHFYVACGLSLRSDIELPGLIPLNTLTDSPEVWIAQGDVPIALKPPLLSQGPNWQLTNAQFLLRVPGVARFLIENARSIMFQPECGLAPEELTAFLTGSVMGLLQHLRGNVVLHASAMLVDDKAVLFCGQSGAGKSTMAAALGKRGHTLLSDDLCTVDTSAADPPVVFPDGRKHKLWEKAIEKLELSDQQGPEVRHQIHKFFVEPTKARTTASPIAAVYDLREARGPDPLEIEKPALAEAAMIIRRNAYRQKIMWRLGQQTNYFRAASQIASQQGIYVLKRPLDFHRIEEVVDRLEAHWQDLGLVGP